MAKDLIETALQIALSVHAGQRDKAGRPYILHPLRVMAKMHTDEERATALLHDVIEDGDYDIPKLLQAGIRETVANAVHCLSKRDGEDYPTFVERVMKNPLAARVKRADIEDNIDVLRLTSLSDKDLQRVAKYHRAWHQLTSAEAEPPA
jgi:(p)ppGpp synthase/HD superfamily hydrolase